MVIKRRQENTQTIAQLYQQKCTNCCDYNCFEVLLFHSTNGNEILPAVGAPRGHTLFAHTNEVWQPATP